MPARVFLWFSVLSMILSACGPGQFLGPTLTPTPTITPMPTDTPTPAATDTPPPTATEKPALPTQPANIAAPVGGTPILIEYFNDNSREWKGLYPSSEVIIQDNRIYLKGTVAEKPAVAYCAGVCGPYQLSYYYQAELIEEQPTANLGIGLVFGLDPEKDTYYAYKIRPSTSEYSLLKLVKGSWTTLITWTAVTNIFSSPQTNIIGVDFQNGTMDLYINGEKIATFIDNDPYNAGRIGFIADKEGVGLIGGNVLVIAQGVAPLPGITATITSLPTRAISPTATELGACPAGVPKNQWVFVVFKQDPGKGTILINGDKHIISQGNNAFYLKTKTNYTMKYGGENAYYNVKKCEIVFVKVK